MQPSCHSFCGGIGDLAAQVVPLLIVHQLQGRSQVLQKVQHSEATQKRWRGRLAVKQPIGVINGLRALGEAERGVQASISLGYHYWRLNGHSKLKENRHFQFESLNFEHLGPVSGAAMFYSSPAAASFWKTMTYFCVHGLQNRIWNPLVNAVHQLVANTRSPMTYGC